MNENPERHISTAQTWRITFVVAPFPGLRRPKQQTSQDKRESVFVFRRRSCQRAHALCQQRANIGVDLSCLQIALKRCLWVTPRMFVGRVKRGSAPGTMSPSRCRTGTSLRSAGPPASSLINASPGSRRRLRYKAPPPSISGLLGLPVGPLNLVPTLAEARYCTSREPARSPRLSLDRTSSPPSTYISVCPELTGSPGPVAFPKNLASGPSSCDVAQAYGRRCR